MMSIEFQGAKPVGKPPSMTDEQCSTAWAMPHLTDVDVVDEKGNVQKGQARNFLLCYQPSKEDKEAIAAGQPIWLNIMTNRLPPHSMWTVDPDTGQGNF
jgi:hypothetical protein